MTAILLTVALVMLSTTIALIVGVPWGVLLSVAVIPPAPRAEPTGIEPQQSRGTWAVNSFDLVRYSSVMITWASICMTLVLPLYIHAAGWESFLGKFGWLPSLGAEQRFWFRGLPAASWVHGLYGACWVAIATCLGIFRVPREVLDAAALSQPQRLVWSHISFPSVLPWIVAGGGINALFAATEMTVADLYGVTTVADEVYKGYALAPETMPVLGAILLPLGLLSAIIIFFLLTLRGRPVVSRSGIWMRAANDCSKRESAYSGGVRKWRSNLTLMLLLFFTLIVGGIPCFSLFLKAGWQVTGGGIATGHEFSAWKAFEVCIAAPRRFQQEIIWSCLLGLATIGTAVPCAGLISGLVTRFERRRETRGGGSKLSALPLGVMGIMVGMLMIPGPIMSLVSIWIFNREPWGWLYDHTLLPTLFAVLPRAIPLAYFFLRINALMMYDGTREAGILESRSVWLRFRILELPRRLDSFFLASVGAFFVAISDVSTTLLVLPPSVSTIAARLFGLMHSGVRNQEAALSLVTVFLVGTISVLAYFLLRWNRRQVQVERPQRPRGLIFWGLPR